MATSVAPLGEMVPARRGVREEAHRPIVGEPISTNSARAPEKTNSMDESRLDIDERRRMRLRSTIARVEHDVSELRTDSTKQAANVVASLTTSWHDLVELLGVPEEPVRRDCPHCGGPIMRDATRCMHCWEKSSAPPIQDLRDGLAPGGPLRAD